MRKNFNRVLVVTLMFVFLLVSVGQIFAEEDIDTSTKYYSPMSEKVTLTTGRELPLEPNFPEGEELENNDVINKFQEILNINYRVDWTVSDQNNAYENRINMLIASNDLPDFLTIDVEPQGMNILSKMVDNGMIMDLTDLWKEYGSPFLKGFHENSDNVSFKDVTFDGKIMAIPNLADIESAIPIIWVRQDWLDNIGLEGPETVDDVFDIVKAFKEQDPDGNGKDDTVVLPGQSILYKDDATATFDWIFGAYNAYPGDWIYKDGKVVYGSVQPEAKAALAKIQEMYEAGLIDKEFLIKSSDDAVEPVVSGKAGVFMGAWWSPWWPLQDSVTNNPEAEWKAYFIKSEDGKAYARSYPAVRRFTVIRKDFEHPELVMKAINWNQLADMRKIDWYNDLKGPGGKYDNTDAGLKPVNSMGSKYLKEISTRYNEIMQVLNGELAYEDAETETQIQVDGIREWQELEDPKSEMGQWSYANQWLLGARVFADYDIQQKIPAYSGSTKVMSQKNAILKDLETENYLNFIVGDKDIDEFDSFVETWSKLGGKDITIEVNQIVAE